MLTIYYGRENIDKEKFIYEKIAETPGKTLVIVPDQYTLEGEKQAFRLLRTQGLLNVEIVSMSRLGSRLIAEQGGGRKTFIDKYGRHMLLGKIARECSDDLQVFGGSMRRNSFLEMTNNFISEMKQYNVAPADLAALRNGLNEGSLLDRKLQDLELIFTKYQEAVSGKYTDSEDLIDLYMSKIPTSKSLQGVNIWVYGFDSFAPKALSVLGHLMAVSSEFNVFLTYDRDCLDEELFRLPEIVMGNLESQAEGFGVKHRRQKVGAGYEAEKQSQAIKTIEQQLYAVRLRPSGDAEGITLVEAANMYGEAESAASHILHLLRDKGMRYRDIVVICNDQKVRGSIISRVFEEYGIKLFDDKKRSIMSSPIAIFMTAMVEVVAGRYYTPDLFKVLKTGFTPIASEDIETLENYAIKYRIRKTMWKKPFTKGLLEYGDDGLEAINQLREQVLQLFTGVEEIYKEAGTVREFLENYYDYLLETVHLDRYILALMEQQEAQGLLELADETGQIWGKIMELFDQIVELVGEEAFDGKDFVQLLTTGLSQMEVGVLPPTSDDILMGTMQRTRSGQAKAILVIGANEGQLPQNAADEGLFSLDELEYLADGGTEICKVEKIRVWEEQLAIYRNLSKPTEELWISYSASDEEGKELRPSEFVDTLKRIFPGLQAQKDILNQGDAKALIGGRINTLRHLTKALQDGGKGDKVDGAWQVVLDWFKKEDKAILDRIANGLSFTNAQPDLPKDMTELLYQKEGLKELILSPSRLERFSRCPFSHFVSYGLRPEERRVFEAASREIGDIYHQCLMEVSECLTKENLWDTVTETECRQLVEEIAQREAAHYREGLFQLGNEEKYKLRRVEDTCFHVCWALIEQVRSGEILDSQYEVPFGRMHSIPPIEVDCGEQTVLIEGKIDRLDIMNEERVKIIDYKTGKEFFDIDEARGGYRLQLMLYLKAAQEKTKKPAGVFYFLIDDPRVDLTETEKEKYFEKISKEMKKSFRLNGIMVNSGSVIRGIAGEFDGYSDIVPLRNGKEGIKATSAGFLLSDEEFAQLQEDVDGQIEKLCRQLAGGRIAINPKKTDRTSPCVYCEYKNICRFDTAFEGCDYEIIK